MNFAIKPAKHSAPGQYLGFGLQPVRAFYHLMTCPEGASVSLELVDDVAIHYPDGAVCLEQTKSALKQNPASDWAIDLWKALHNWLLMLQDGSLTAGSCSFRLYVTPVKAGKFAATLSNAASVQEVANFITYVRKGLSKAKTAPVCLSFLQPILDAEEHLQTALIQNFQFLSCDNDPIDPLRTLLMPTIDPIHIDVLLASGIGQAKEAFEKLIRLGKPPIISAASFQASFRAFVQKNNLPGLLNSLTRRPENEIVITLAAERPRFIRQLEIIDVDSEERLRAVSDFLRTAADKVDWAERGLIFEGSLDIWEDDLTSSHDTLKRDIIDLYGDKTAETKGRLLYRQCARSQLPLDGRQVPGHFMNGSYNDLADRLLIGWHADYKSFFEEESK